MKLVCLDPACRTILEGDPPAGPTRLGCPACGLVFARPGPGPDGTIPVLPRAPEPCPWRRLAARFLDGTLLTVVTVGALLLVRSPTSIPGLVGFWVAVPALVMLLTFLGALGGAVALAVCGSSPGKWILATSVRVPDGSRPRLEIALRRNLSAWWNGLGGGFFLTAPFLALAAMRDLRRRHQTVWDRDLGLDVIHEPIRAGRLLATAVVIVGLVVGLPWQGLHRFWIPSLLEARELNDRAWRLATSAGAEARDGRKSMELARRAAVLTGWADPMILDTLAAAHAEAGEFEEAVRWQTRALDLQGTDRDGFISRLDLYHNRTPYRRP